MTSARTERERKEFFARLASRENLEPEALIDFSGFSLSSEAITGQDMAYGLYNGCNFERLGVRNCNLGDSEFCETEIRDSVFTDCSFEKSDFMEARVVRCKFVRCSFKDGEWRETSFDGCRFEDCTFVYTTMALCTYKSCTFDETSSKSFVGPSKRYNVFLETSLLLDEGAYSFLEKNIGIQGQHPGFFEPAQGQDPFTLLSVRIFLQIAKEEDFATSSMEAIQSLSSQDGPSAYTRLRYVVLATKKFVEERKLSVISTLYLSDHLIATSQDSRRHDIAMEVAGLVIFCRQFVLEEMGSILAESDACEELVFPTGAQGVIHCQANHDAVLAIELVRTMEVLMSQPEGTIQVGSVRPGSTIIEVVLVSPVFVAAWLKAVAYLTDKGKILYRHTREKIREWQDVRQARRTTETMASALAVTLVQAVNTFDGNPEIKLLRAAIQQGRERVLHFEGKIEIRLTIQD